MASRFDNRYESDGSDYEEYSGDEKTSSGNEYLTESEHELSADDDEELASHSDEDQNEETTFSEPEPETDDEATEEMNSEEEDELGKMFDEIRHNRNSQKLDIDELEKIIDQPNNDDEKEETNSKPVGEGPGTNAEKTSTAEDNNKTVERKVDANENTATEKTDCSKIDGKEADLSNKSQYPKEILVFLENKQNKTEESEILSSDSSKESDNDDDYEKISDKTEQENKDDGGDKPTDTKNEGSDENRHHSRHLYTQVLMPTRRTYWVSVPQAEKNNWSCKDRSKMITLRPHGRFGHREYRIIAREMEKTRRRHVTGKYSGFDILKIQKVVNPCLWRRYRLNRREVKMQNEGDANEKMLFHGSPAWRSLVAAGFDEKYSSIDSMFGAGLYFAENSSKSNQYVFGFTNGNRCPTHKAKNCMICERVLLLCRVTLGKVKQVTNAEKFAHAPANHNSVMAVPRPGGLLYCEYVVYKGEQVYPEYTITYKLKP